MFAFRDRRAKKRDFRKLFIIRLSAAAEMRGLRYSRLIHGLRLAKIGLDRKSLSELAIHDPETLRRDRRPGPRGARQARRGRAGPAAGEDGLSRSRSARPDRRPIAPARRPDRPRKLRCHPLDPAANPRLAELDALRSRGPGGLRAGGHARRGRGGADRVPGQKQGRVKAAQERLKSLEPAGKRAYGQRFNAVKQALEAACEAAQAAGRAAARSRPARSTSRCPASGPELGHRHPLTQTADELIDLFGRFGFAVARGPEVEDIRHNFDALNIPPSPPGARPARQLLPLRRDDAPEPDEHGADPGHGEPAAAGPGDRHRPGLSARHGRRDALVHVPPDRGPDGRPRA